MVVFIFSKVYRYIYFEVNALVTFNLQCAIYIKLYYL